jgi:hypothetical protein
MALLSEWNWWSPAPLRRLHNRIGLDEGEARESLGSEQLGIAAAAGCRIAQLGPRFDLQRFFACDRACCRERRGFSRFA